MTQDQTAMQFPKCGGVMTATYEGELHDKRVVCQFCGTTYDLDFGQTGQARRI
jgi:hypothetical protein